MPMTPSFDHSHLTPAERAHLARDLANAVPYRDCSLAPAQRAELDRRWEEHLRNPDEGETWDVVLAEILNELDEEDRTSAA